METWLTPELRIKVRKVFEPRYKRTLTEKEIVEIANNLADFVQHFIQFKARKEYGKQNSR